MLHCLEGNEPTAKKEVFLLSGFRVYWAVIGFCGCLLWCFLKAFEEMASREVIGQLHCKPPWFSRRLEVSDPLKGKSFSSAALQTHPCVWEGKGIDHRTSDKIFLRIHSHSVHHLWQILMLLFFTFYLTLFSFYPKVSLINDTNIFILKYIFK